MKDIEQFISPLIESQFPEFYKEEGPLFVEFCKAYFEWIQQSDQAVGKGRNLFSLRDIDKTIDDFTLYFKLKYLPLIKYDTATDKRFIVKHVQDLYRSKGTERSVDLFFRLVYGVPADVYFPAKDLFRLSDNEWVRPFYLELTPSPITLGFIGNQITGLTSGATAFVENYIRALTDNKYINILYISNIAGQFIAGEKIVKGNQFDADAPTIIGSATELEVLFGGIGFEVGEFVTFESGQGSSGIARVASTTDVKRTVDFSIADGGWGYIAQDVPVQFDGKTNVSNTADFISIPDHTFQNSDAVIYYNTAGYTPIGGLANGQTYYVTSSNSSGVKLASTRGGSPIDLTSKANTEPLHLLVGTLGSNIYISDTILFVGNVVVNTAYSRDVPYLILDTLVQPLATIEYNTASANISVGDTITRYYTNGTVIGSGSVVNAEPTSASAGLLVVQPLTGNLQISYTSNTLYTSANAKSAELVVYTDQTKQANIVGYSSNVTIRVSAATATQYQKNSVVYCVNSSGSEIANARVFAAAYSGTDAILTLRQAAGRFPVGNTLFSKNNSAQSTVANIEMTVGVYGSDSKLFATYPNNFCYTVSSNTRATIKSVGEGDGAQFSIGSDLAYQELVTINYDLIKDYANVALNAIAYGFPKYPTANLSTDFLSDILLTRSVNVGTIQSLSGIGPGSNYSQAPFIYVTSPQIATKDKKDYELVIQNQIGSFTLGEQIYQGTGIANGVISSISNTTHIVVRRTSIEDFQGAGNTTIVGVDSGATASIVNIITALTSNVAGNNAVITATVQSGRGQIQTLEVMDAGFGYLDTEEVVVQSLDQQREASAKVNLKGAGYSKGYSRDRRSYLSADKYLFDGDYYQEYSYDVRSSITLDKYRDVFKQTMHLAGTKAFATLVSISYVDSGKGIVSTTVEQQ